MIPQELVELAAVETCPARISGVAFGSPTSGGKSNNRSDAHPLNSPLEDYSCSHQAGQSDDEQNTSAEGSTLTLTWPTGFIRPGASCDIGKRVLPPHAPSRSRLFRHGSQASTAAGTVPIRSLVAWLSTGRRDREIPSRSANSREHCPGHEVFVGTGSLTCLPEIESRRQYSGSVAV